MSTIADIKLNRVDLALARHDPIQLSDNLQLTLNLYTELTIVEPRNPSYHNAIIKNQHRTVLNTKEIFSVGTILYSEAVSSLPVGRFKDVVFKNGDEPYNITVQDPIIVEHQWTSINPHTRDSWLGVLFNTGEVLVLGRENHNQIYNYKIKMNVFEALVKLYDIPFHEGKWYVSGKEFRQLKIKFFAFHENELAVVDLDNRITIFDFKMNVVKQIDVEKVVAKIYWVKDTFLIVGKDNSLLVATDETREIYPAQQGYCQKVKITQFNGKSLIIAVFMSKVVIFANDNIYEYDTETWYTCTSIVTGMGEILLIMLAYEDSTILTIKFDRSCISKVANDLSWSLFKDRALNMFQMSLEDATTEGSMILHGIQPISDKILAVVYKVLPKNALHFRIPSELSVSLTFIQLESSMGLLKHPVINTSIAKLACFYLENFTTIPTVIDDLTMSQMDKIDVFVPQLQVFVDEMLQPKQLPQPETISGDLEQDLINNFVHNRDVAENQFKHCLSRLLLLAVGSIQNSGNEMARQLLTRVGLLQFNLNETITRYIVELLFRIYRDKYIENEVDRFSLLALGMGVEMKLNDLDKAKLKVGNNLVEEFVINLNDDDTLIKTNMICSTQGRFWRFCDLTRIPIVDGKTKMDELAFCNYLYGDLNAPIVDTLRRVIDYCHINGNRTYIGQF